MSRLPTSERYSRRTDAAIEGLCKAHRWQEKVRKWAWLSSRFPAIRRAYEDLDAAFGTFASLFRLLAGCQEDAFQAGRIEERAYPLTLKAA